MGLNFQGALAGLGHGLTTLGTQGLEERQRVAADARISAREMALANLHHDWAEQDTAQAPADYKAMTGVTVDRAAQEAERVQLPLRRVEAQITRDNADHNSARDFQEQMALLNARDRVDFNRWRQQHGIEQNDTRSLELWRQEHGIGGEGASHYLRDATSGHYIAEDRNGIQRDTGITFPVSNSGDDLGLGDNNPAPSAPSAGRGGRPVLAAPRPAARGADTPPVPGAFRGPDRQWYLRRGNQTFRVDVN